MKTKKQLTMRQIAAKYGKRGGKATVKRHGKDHMIKIAKRGAKARWKDHV